MKNLLLLLACFLLIGIGTSSCKKNWTCECATPNGSDSVSYELNELRKNDAESKCIEYGKFWGSCTIR